MCVCECTLYKYTYLFVVNNKKQMFEEETKKTKYLKGWTINFFHKKSYCSTCFDVYKLKKTFYIKIFYQDFAANPSNWLHIEKTYIL